MSETLDPSSRLAALKASSPLYEGMTDLEFASKVYRKHYADKMDFPAFAQQAGLRFEQYSPTGGAGENFAAGLGKSFVDTARGVGQLVGLVDDADITAARARDAELMRTGGGMLGNIAGVAGQMMAIPGVGGGAAALGRAAPYVGAASQAGGLAALQGTAGDESRLENALISGALGAGGQGIASGVSRFAKGASDTLSPAVARSIETLERAGVPLHASQVSGSKALKTIASGISALPLSGAAKAKEKQMAAFTKAVSRTFGHEVDTLSDDAMLAARQKISATYEDVFSKKPVLFDSKDFRRLAQIERELPTKLKPDEVQVVKANIDQLREMARRGPIPGRVYQAMRSDLASDGTRLGESLKKIRAVFDSAAFGSVGAKDAARLQAANQQWANFKTVEGALKQVGGAWEQVPPSALWPLVRKGATKEMRELARAGQVVLKDPIPDSGTAGRMLGYGALGGGGIMGDPASMLALVVAGAMTGRALNSPLLGRYLAHGAGDAGNVAARLAKPAPFLLPASAYGAEKK